MSDAQVERFTECSSLHQMMLIVFSKILHLREYYEDCYFFDLKIHGVTTPIIDVTNPFVNYLIADSIKGAASAADQRYLRNVQLIFKLLNDKPERFVERYVIVFDEDNNPELVSPSRRAPLSPIPDQHWNREDIIQMSSAVDEICGDLIAFPDDEEKRGGLQVMFRLDYNRNCPEGYHAPHYERSNYTRLKFSNLLPAVPVKKPPPRRSISDKDKKVRSVLSVQSLLTRGNSLPPPTREQSVNTLMNSRTDTSISSPYRKSRDRSKESSQVPPRQKREPSEVVLDDDEDEEVEEEEVTDEEEEEPEEIEIIRGEEDGKERRKRSIDSDEKEDGKRARSISSSPLVIEALDRMNREYDPNTTIMSSSMDVGNNTILQKTLTSPPSTEMLSIPASSPTEKGGARKKDDDASIFSSYRESRDRSMESSQVSPRQKREPSEVVLEDDDDEEEDEEELEEEEVTDEEEEELEDIDINGGEDDGKERRKRSIDRDEEEDGKRARSISSSPLVIEALDRMNREYDPNTTIMSSSMDVGNNTILQKTLTSPPSTEMLSIPASSPTEKGGARKKDDDDDPNKTVESMDSDGGEELFIN